MEPVFVSGSIDLDAALGSGNSSLIEDFPYWRLAMAIRLVVVVVIFIPIMVFFGTTVLFTFLSNKSLINPVNIVHMLLTAQLFFLKFTILVVAVILFPDAIRYCVCIEAIIDVYFSLTAFSITFVNIVLTCLAIIQLLIMKGKKKLIVYKVVGVLMSLSMLYSVAWAMVSLTINRVQGTQLLCTSLCMGLIESTFTAYTLLLVGLIIFVISPCLVIIFIAFLWSYIIFKKSYIGNDNQLNRRILSLPLIMPLVTVVASILYFIVRELFENILKSTVTSFFPNWVLLSNEILGYLLEGTSGFIYPVLLLYVHPQLRSSWCETLNYIPGALNKKLFGKLKANNQVHPAPLSLGRNNTKSTAMSLLVSGGD